MNKTLLKYENEKFIVIVASVLSNDGKKELYEVVDVQCKKCADGVSIDEDGYVRR